MQKVRQIAEAIVAREGGFVNDPDDPGGATKFGVTLGTMQRLGIDLTRDGRVTEADVRALTRAQAVDIFIRHYFQDTGVHLLPEDLQASCFDMHVNAGRMGAKLLQRLLTRMGYPTTVDGSIGPKTAANAKAAAAGRGLYMRDAYGIERRNYYYALADSRPASRKYVCRKDGGKGGWITRAEEFISPHLHLSGSEHRARVAKWA